MGWFSLALLTGALVALRDALMKRGARRADEYATIFMLSATTVVLLGLVLIVVGVPRLGAGLPAAILGSAVPNVLAYVLLVRSVRLSDLSLVAPLMGLTPLFLLVTSPLILGESAGALGLLGVLLIVIGAYVLNAGDVRHGALEPFRALLRDRGARTMLGVAFLWSISANYDKIGVQATSPIAWPVVVHAIVALALAPVVLARRGGRRQARSDGVTSSGGGMPPLILLAGLANALAMVTQMTALTLTLVPYVIALKRTSVLFSVGLGRLMFGEGHMRERALGASLILAGVIVFALGG